MPSRTQITRHDCVEGWSCIAKWTGMPLALVLDQAWSKPQARYVVFHCMDTIERSLSGNIHYYGSIDLIDARHPQTILAYGLNGKPLPVDNGAPLRVRVERQLGYKMPKYIHKIEVVDSFAADRLGQGRLLGRQRLRLVWRDLTRCSKRGHGRCTADLRRCRRLPGQSRGDESR